MKYIVIGQDFLVQQHFSLLSRRFRLLLSAAVPQPEESDGLFTEIYIEWIAFLGKKATVVDYLLEVSEFLMSTDGQNNA